MGASSRTIMVSALRSLAAGAETEEFEAVGDGLESVAAGDALCECGGGGWHLRAPEFLQRDLFVVEKLGRVRIPRVMWLSGGYSRKIYQLAADSVLRLVKIHG